MKMVFGSAMRQSARVFSSARRQSAAVAASAVSATAPVRASTIQTWPSSSSCAAFVTPQHYANDATAVLAGVAVVGAVVGVGKMWWDASSSGATGSGAEITREDTARFFAELTAEVQNLVVRLAIVVCVGCIAGLTSVGFHALCMRSASCLIWKKQCAPT